MRIFSFRANGHRAGDGLGFGVLVGDSDAGFNAGAQERRHYNENQADVVNVFRTHQLGVNLNSQCPIRTMILTPPSFDDDGIASRMIRFDWVDSADLFDLKSCHSRNCRHSSFAFLDVNV